MWPCHRSSAFQGPSGLEHTVFRRAQVIVHESGGRRVFSSPVQGTAVDRVSRPLGFPSVTVSAKGHQPGYQVAPLLAPQVASSPSQSPLGPVGSARPEPPVGQVSVSRGFGPPCSRSLPRGTAARLSWGARGFQVPKASGQCARRTGRGRRAGKGRGRRWLTRPHKKNKKNLNDPPKNSIPATYG